MTVTIVIDGPELYRDLDMVQSSRYALWSVGGQFVVCKEGVMTADLARDDLKRIGFVNDSEIKGGITSLPLLPILRKHVLVEGAELTLKLAPGVLPRRAKNYCYKGENHLFSHNGKLVIASDARPSFFDATTVYHGTIENSLPFNVCDLPTV